MSIRRQQKKRARLSSLFGFRLVRGLLKRAVQGLLRVLLKFTRKPRWASAGFVLPTTVLLLLIVTLTVGSISLRTLSRTTQTIGDRQQRVIYNAATPAIDRAKAKLEFLFDPGQDNRLPTGIPGEEQLMQMMLNREPVDPGDVRQLLISAPDPANPAVTRDDIDPYEFPDEDRLDLDNDGLLDNAWFYRVDTDRNGLDDALVVYSILFSTPTEIGDLSNASDEQVALRADALEVRNGPLSGLQFTNPLCANRVADAPPIATGWFTDFAASRKNFQVDAVVIPLVEERVANGELVEGTTGTTATLEFQQDRQYDSGNKWGAWFRNDLEIYSFPDFNWNGAMHTEGNLIVGRRSLTAYLVSSPNSCIFDRQSSEITVSEVVENPENNTPEFTGQTIGGQLFALEDVNPLSRFHIFNTEEPDQPITGGDDVRLEPENDSIVNESSPDELSLDPVILFTSDLSVPRSETPIDFEQARDEGWLDRVLAQPESGRIVNTTRTTPNVDDFYRADDRLGPKPRYGRQDFKEFTGVIGDDDIPIGSSIQGSVSGPEATQQVTRLTRNNAVNENVGLDGYWERRALGDGMRLIVGQRLELGNAFGWKGEEDSLYPWEVPEIAPDVPDPDFCTDPTDRCYEAKQRRALRDNLAAVQSLAVYHSVNNGGDFPRACISVTSHPATPATIRNSTTFQSLLEYGLDLSFLDGHGTNGWEYAPPSRATFATDVSDGQPLGIALRNLAHFAGDPNGGSPSFPSVQDNEIHPYPNLAMWGDFAMLRRILESGTAYDNLSVADKTYIHTAACTLGMLASELDQLNQYDYADLTNESDLVALNTEIDTVLINLREAQNRGSATPSAAEVANGGELVDTTDGSGTPVWRFYHPNGDESTFAEIIQPATGISNVVPPEAVLAVLNSNAVTDPNLQPVARLAEVIHLREQALRDRQFGFRADPVCADLEAYVAANPTLGATGTSNHLASVLCPTQAKFPSLYYLFPESDHAHNGVVGDPTTAQPEDEPYIGDSSYVFEPDSVDPTTPVGGVNDTYVYRVINTLDPDDFTGVALSPRTSPDDPNWLTPTSNTPTDENPNVITVNDGAAINVAGTEADFAVSFLDKGIYNGREAMNVRTLDMDLDLLRNLVPPAMGGGDTWLPQLSVIYGFREDTVREDMIVRPESVPVGSCSTDVSIQTAICLIDAVGATPQDPPLTAGKAISPKAVDYYADPDRRINGFRLRNGVTIERPEDNGRGISFISDNPVYIQGSFNLHQAGCGTDACLIEEFDQTLDNDGNGEFTPEEFYGRVDLDVRFADEDQDFWRPSEILADAVTILSGSFCDGSIEDSFITAGDRNDAVVANSDVYRCAGGTDVVTSYLNQNRPTDFPDSGAWLRENPYDDPIAAVSPIAITRNGALRDSEDPTDAGLYPDTDYYEFLQRRSLMEAEDAIVNAVIVSGIVPSRPNQSYGGLHNFPRFLENWQDHTLRFSGAFFQLAFSNSSTAPYDQEVWSPEENPTLVGEEFIEYYQPPLRAWGYDVGLQYAPAPPITKRLANPGSFRSEFYNEPEADDPYISNLREAVAPLLVE